MKKPNLIGLLQLLGVAPGVIKPKTASPVPETDDQYRARFVRDLSAHLVSVMRECGGELSEDNLLFESAKWSGSHEHNWDRRITGHEFVWARRHAVNAYRTETADGKWPLGINPTVDAAVGLPEWSCWSPNRADRWVRRDGAVCYFDETGCREKVIDGLAAFNRTSPMGKPRKIVPARSGGIRVLGDDAGPHDAISGPTPPETEPVSEAEEFCAEFDRIRKEAGESLRLQWEKNEDKWFGSLLEEKTGEKTTLFVLEPVPVNGSTEYILFGAFVPDNQAGQVSFPLKAAHRAAEMHLQYWVNRNTLGWRD